MRSWPTTPPDTTEPKHDSPPRTTGSPVPEAVADGQPERPPTDDEVELVLQLTVPSPVPQSPEQRLLRILGPLQLDTAAVLSPQEISIAAFLVVTGGATSEEVLTMIWNGDVTKRAYASNVMSKLARKLTREVLPRIKQGQPYRIVGYVTDAAILEENLAQALESDHYDSRVKLLREALSFVRGPVLTPPGLPGPSWKWLSYHTAFQTRTQGLVTTAAHLLAEISFDAEDYATTRWAAERATLAVPTSASLTEWVIRSHLANGSVHEATRAVEAFEERVRTLDCGEPPTGPRDLLRRAS